MKDAETKIGAGCLGLILVAVLAWISFIIWVIVTLVNWLVTK